MDVITNRQLRHILPLFTVFAAVVLFLAAAALLALGKDVFVPLALATLLSFALAPIVVTLQRWGVPRGPSVFAAVLLSMLVLGAIVSIIAGQLADLAADLPTYRSTIQGKIAALRQSSASGDTFNKAAQVASEILAELRSIGTSGGAEGAAAPVVAVKTEEMGTLAAIGVYASPLLKPLATGAIVFLFAIFMLVQREDLRNRFIKLIGTDDLQKTTRALDDAGGRLGKLLLTQFLLNAAFGLAIGLGLLAIGLPSPFLWGIIAGLMRFVPYIGAVIGVALPLAVAFAVDPGWSMLIWTLILFVAVEPVVAHGIEPLLVGRNTGISPIAVLVSATLWAFLWGPIGLVLATPLTICLVVIGRHVPRLAFLDTILGDRPPLLPSEMLYQRLLAGDPREATMQAREFLKQRAMSTYFDEIVLEAIRLAHRDIVRNTVEGERITRMVAATDTVLSDLSSIDSPVPRGGLAGSEAAAAAETLAPDSAVANTILLPEDMAPRWRTATPVLIVAGDHPLDAPVARMLAQLFLLHGLGARVIGFQEALKERDRSSEPPALICFSFIEPLSTLHLRTASRRARLLAPDSLLMLGIWRQRDPHLQAELSRRLRFDMLVTTMADALSETMAVATTRPLSRSRSPARRAKAWA